MTALLDAQAGIQYEGERAADPDTDTLLAVAAWNHLANGTGGMDWHGLDAVTALLDIADDQLELLLHRLAVIKRHRPPEAARG